MASTSINIFLQKVTKINTSALSFSTKITAIDRINIDDNKQNKNTTTDRTIPEAPTTCCMSGCANCVWIEYAEKLSEYFKDGGTKALDEINNNVDDPNLKAFLLFELRMRNIK